LVVLFFSVLDIIFWKKNNMMFYYNNVIQ
jgi:hypothetical protein